MKSGHSPFRHACGVRRQSRHHIAPERKNILFFPDRVSVTLAHRALGNPRFSQGDANIRSVTDVTLGWISGRERKAA
jgi:hypothetical protein